MHRGCAEGNRKVRISLKNFIRNQLGVDPPAHRNGGSGQKDEKDGVTRPVFPLIADLIARHLGVKGTFPAALCEIVRSRHHGALFFHLFANALGRLLDEGFVLRNFGIESLFLVGKRVVAFLLKKHGVVLLYLRG